MTASYRPLVRGRSVVIGGAVRAARHYRCEPLERRVLLAGASMEPGDGGAAAPEGAAVSVAAIRPTALQPDLIGWECYVTPDTNVTWGSVVEVQSQVMNLGTAAVTAPFFVRYYLSNDPTFGDGDDVLLRTYDHQADVPTGLPGGPDYTVTVTLPAAAPAGYGGAGPFYIGMQTDALGEIVESNEANNFAAIGRSYDWNTFTVFDADLMGWDCFVTPATDVSWGSTLRVQGQVQNAGVSAVTTSFYVEYYLSNDLNFGDADDVFLHRYDHVAAVPGGGFGPEYTVSFNLPATVPAGYGGTGPFYVGMKTDSANGVVESDEGNNFGDRTGTYDWDSFTLADVDLSSFYCNLTTSTGLVWGASLEVWSAVWNSGGVTVTEPFYVDFFLSSDLNFGDADDVLLGYYEHVWDVPGNYNYGPATALTLALPATAPTAEYDGPGPFYVAMKTDSANDIAEFNETNNFGATVEGREGWDSFTLADVDLYGQRCDVQPGGMLTWGSNLSVQSRVGNLGGTAVTAPFYVDYFLSNDLNFGDADDVRLLRYDHVADVPGAGGGGGPEYAVTLPLPAAAPAGYSVPGPFYIAMKTDALNEVPEYKESNNFGRLAEGYDWDYFHLFAADLSGWDCSLVPDANVAWGSPLSVRSQVVNGGPSTVTAPFYVDYFLSNDLTFGDADDKFLYRYDHQDDLPGNGTGPAYAATVPLPAAPPAGYGGAGPFYVGMSTDPLDEVPETIETNNFGYAGEHYDWDSFTAMPYLAIDDVSVSEGDGGTRLMTFSVGLSHASGQVVTVAYATADDSATAGSDYAAASGTLTFPAGSLAPQTLGVTVNGDYAIEADETFHVDLAAAGALVADGRGVGTITNDDQAGSLQFAAASYSVGEGGGSASITVTRTGGRAAGVGVSYATADATATAGLDYAATSGTYVLGGGQASFTFSVPVSPDGLVEGDETVSLVLSGPTGGGTLGSPGAAVLTILDVDATAPVLVSAVSRKTHGAAGDFDLGLSLTGTTRATGASVEPRKDGPTQLLFTFSEAVQAVDGVLDGSEFAVTNATFASASISGSTLSLNLTGVVNTTYVTVQLLGLGDGAGNPLSGDADVTVGALYGDIDQSGSVNLLDFQRVKLNLLQPLTASSFLADLDAGGGVNLLDFQAVKVNLLKGLS